MNKFDKLKIVAPLDCLNSWQPRNDVYKTSSPYLLCIRLNRIQGELTIEFTGKILLDRYQELINVENIRHCFEKINALGICTLDIERLLNTASVTKADFTRDILLTDMDGVENIRQLKSLAKLSIVNYRRWVYQDYLHNGLVINNVVTNPRCRRRLIIYDKSHELNLASNRAFVNALTEPDILREYFTGRVRFELNATTKHQLRNWLHIPDTSLSLVLNAENNPLYIVMSEMFRPINQVEERRITLRDNDRIALLKLLDWDLAAVETHIREHCGRSVTDSMRPYRELYAMHHEIARPIDIREYVR